MKKFLFVLFLCFVSLSANANNNSLYNEKILLKHQLDSLEKIRENIVTNEIHNNYNEYQCSFIYIEKPISLNSAGGTGPAFYFSNVSEKTIKYLKVTGYFTNRVNDKIKNKFSLSNTYSYTFSITGPIDKGYFEDVTSENWDPLFYNSDACDFTTTSITLIYMNNTQKTFSGTVLKKIQNKSIEKIKHDNEIRNYKTSAFIDINNKIDKINNRLNELKNIQINSIPLFEGGDVALMKFIQTNMQYPKMAAENNIQGKVVLQFSVNENSEVINIKVVRSVDKDLDNEVIRVIKLTNGKWSGGYSIDTKTNKVEYGIYTLPFTFKLQGNN